MFNNSTQIQHCLESIAKQNYPLLEHIIIDGGSKDGTVEIIKKHAGANTQWISEKDKGMYDALNKGIRMATGEVVGVLHSDDLFAHENVITLIAAAFEDEDIEVVYGDIKYVSKYNTEKVIRYWHAGAFHRWKLIFGWMPPHTSVFVKKDIYERFGFFNTSFKIASDYEMMLRLFSTHRVQVLYIPEVLVLMRAGGISNRNLEGILLKSKEDLRALKISNRFFPWLTLFCKNIRKIPQFLRKS